MQTLHEMFSFASYMDVSELRSLYYGRLDLYVSFTDDNEYVTETPDAPDGIVAHSVETVVARRASTSYFYARVFRFRKSDREVMGDLRYYSLSDLDADRKALGLVRGVDREEVDRLFDSLMETSDRPFDVLWVATKRLSGGDAGRWAKILLDVGYSAIVDNTGSGYFSDAPAILILESSSRIDIDIVPIQKYRQDSRQRVVDLVDREVKRLRTTRNRISKKKTEESRRAARIKAAAEKFRSSMLAMNNLEQ